MDTRLNTPPARPPRYWALIPAAGVGARMGSLVPKQYMDLLGEPIIQLTLKRFLSHPRIDAAVVVLRPDDPYWATSGLSQILGAQSVAYLRDGELRNDSVRAGLRLLDARAAAHDWILVHDAVRPCLCAQDIDRLIDGVGEDEVGGLLGAPVRDTMKRVSSSDGSAAPVSVSPRVEATVPRRDLWHALTPQMFRFELLVRALEEAAATGSEVTDEASAIERLGLRPIMVEGRADNIKITRPDDLTLARLILLAERQREATPQRSGIRDVRSQGAASDVDADAAGTEGAADRAVTGPER